MKNSFAAKHLTHLRLPAEQLIGIKGKEPCITYLRGYAYTTDFSRLVAMIRHLVRNRKFSTVTGNSGGGERGITVPVPQCGDSAASTAIREAIWRDIRPSELSSLVIDCDGCHLFYSDSGHAHHFSRF
jgi:hypothetical protein